MCEKFWHFISISLTSFFFIFLNVLINLRKISFIFIFLTASIRSQKIIEIQNFSQFDLFIARCY